MMVGAQWLLEGALLLLLGATLFHAIRLESALGVLKRDRAVLEGLVAEFNSSTSQAAAGVDRLRAATDGAGRAIAKQIDQAQRLRDDLHFLTERGDRLAERMESAIRSSRMFADLPVVQPTPRGYDTHTTLQPASEPDRRGPDLRTTLSRPSEHSGLEHQGQDYSTRGQTTEQMPRLRSQAERDLLRALRGGR